MELLHQSTRTGVSRNNIIVIPGLHAARLEHQTCDHFTEFLNELVGYQRVPTTLRVFKHDLKINDLENWEGYCFAGEKLLAELKYMIACGDHDPEEDSFILIAHKLGGFILKSALVNAHRQKHRPEEDDILNSIDLLMLFGDPQLTTENRADWVKLMSACCCTEKLPKQLGLAQAVRCLQELSENFSKVTTWASLVQLDGGTKMEKKHRFPFRKHHQNNCICNPLMSMMEETTAGKRTQIEPQEGEANVCTFSAKSSHYQNLIKHSDARVYASIRPRDSLQHLLSAECSAPEPLASSGCPAGLTTTPTPPEAKLFRDNEENKPLASSQPGNKFRGDLHSVASSGMPCLPEISRPVSHSTSDRNDSGPTGSQRVQISNSVFENDVSISTQASAETSTPQANVTTIDKTSISEAANAQGDSDTCQILKKVHQRKFMEIGGNSHDEDTFWVGSDADISTILKALHLAKDHSNIDGGDLKCSYNKVLLHGCPGSGKTRMAEKIVTIAKPELDLVVWLHCLNPATLGASHHQAAVQLGLCQDFEGQCHQRSLQLFMQYLATTTERWLVILDDADHVYPEMRKSIPPSSGRCLITSRSRYIADDLAIEPVTSIQLGPLSFLYALPLLRMHAPEAYGQTDKKLLEDIVWACEFRPLPITVVAKLVSRTGISFEYICKKAITISKAWAQGDHYGTPKLAKLMAPPGRKDIASRSSMRSGVRILGKRKARASKRYMQRSPSTYAILTTLFRLLVQEWQLPTGDLAIHLASSFLSPNIIEETILLSSRKQRDGTSLLGYPQNERDIMSSVHGLWRLGMLDSKSRGVWQRAWALQEACLISMNNEQFIAGFRAASTLLLLQWPKPRKLEKLTRGYWPEFDSLHSHVWTLASTYLGCVDSDLAHSKGRSVCRRRIPASHLLTDSFLRLIVYCSWYNACRGNEEEDLELFQLASSIILLSNVASRNGSSLDMWPARNGGVLDTIDCCNHIMLECSGIELGERCQAYSSPIIPRQSQRHRLGLKFLESSTQSFCDLSDLPTVRVFTRPLDEEFVRPPDYCGVIHVGNMQDRGDWCTSAANMASGSRLLTLDGLPISLSRILTMIRQLGLRYAWVDLLCLAHDGIENPPWTAQESTLRMCQNAAYLVCTEITDDQPQSTAKRIGKRRRTPVLVTGTNHPAKALAVRAAPRNHNTTGISQHEQPEEDENLHAKPDNMINELLSRRLDDARKLWNDVKHDDIDSNMIGTLAKLTRARDITSAFARPCTEAIQLYTCTTAHLALLYCQTGQEHSAKLIVEDLLEHLSLIEEKMRPDESTLGQLFSTKVAVDLSLAQDPAECLRTAEHALALVSPYQQTEPSVADLVSTTKIRMARCHMRLSDFAAAKSHVQEAIDHFERSEAASSQLHLARALRQQACIYECQHNKMMDRAMQAAAKELLLEVRQTQSLNGRCLPEVCDFSLQAYDRHIMEFWLR